ncbi:MAG: hypothetical protein QNJ90_13160 [Planctomycetota bacterium]|nr:hypothetical protein [Planctomycetota bacterium]
MGRLILVSFAGTTGPSDEGWDVRQQGLADSARRHGFHEIVSWTRPKLMATPFYAAHRDVLDRPRGAGYWAWKPYIIRQALEDAREGDHVVYWDVGRGREDARETGNRFRRSIRPLVRWCDRQGGGALPGVWIPQSGANGMWTKRDCFARMGCDEPRYWEAPQVSASFSIWRRDARSLAFVDRWLACVCDPQLVTDDPNTCGLPDLPGFVDHRHDQSILTNLVLLEGLCAPWSTGGASKDMNRLVRRLSWRGRFRSPRDPALKARAQAAVARCGQDKVGAH